MNFCRFFVFIALFQFIYPVSAQFGGMGGQMAPDSTKKLKIAAVPLLNYNRSIGFVAGALGMGFYRLDQNDTISPPSVTGLMAMYTSNKTWAAFGFQQFYFKEDRWRSTLAAGVADVNFQVYMDLLPPSGGFVGYNTAMTFVYLKGQRAVIPDLFAGLHYIYYRANTKFDIAGNPIDTGIDDFHALGVNFAYDSRDNVSNPQEGWNIELDVSFYTELLGSTNDYTVYDLAINKYWRVNPKGIIAGRLSSAVSAGDVPFTGENVVMGTDLRGYTDGKHRANQVHSIQGEYRWNLYKKFGLVFFGGVAVAIDKVSELSFNGLLPAVGTGIRYMMIPDENINIGLDVAVGIQDWGINFRITEAF